MKRNNSDTPETNHSSNDPRPDVEYIGLRVGGTAVVLNLTDRRQLSLDRSLDLARHSPTGFKWGFRGSGPAQLALALLLDYTDDAAFALAHYTAFKEEVVSDLSCDSPADCWHLTSAEIDATLADDTEEAVIAPDGGQAEPALASNWRAVKRPDRTVYQRHDVDHYIVTSEAPTRGISSSVARATVRTPRRYSDGRTGRSTALFVRWKPRFIAVSRSSGAFSIRRSTDRHRSTSPARCVRATKDKISRETAVVAADRLDRGGHSVGDATATN